SITRADGAILRFPGGLSARLRREVTRDFLGARPPPAPPSLGGKRKLEEEEEEKKKPKKKGKNKKRCRSHKGKDKDGGGGDGGGGGGEAGGASGPRVEEVASMNPVHY
ncbi:hypothetical protein N0V82_007656, partial [Gnomoniopsis sp. IMI 355080]